MASHPLEGLSIELRSLKCFSDKGSGHFAFSPITFIIGRNNSGKSTIIDGLQAVAGKDRPTFSDYGIGGKATELEVKAKFPRNVLERHFRAGVRTGLLYRGSDWDYAEEHILGRRFTWKVGSAGAPELIDTDFEVELHPQAIKMLSDIRVEPFRGLELWRIAAERDVVREQASSIINIGSNGAGLTNAIQLYINSVRLPRHVVEEQLLRDLNEIYRGDARFTAILCQIDDHSGHWEIYLREEGKGDIPLSQSGSSLKTVFLIASYLLIGPDAKISYNHQKLLFCIEEPENNLHPSLLRRLLEFLSRQRDALGFSLIISTHSPICVDWASKRADATVLHIRRNERGITVCRNVLDHLGRTGVLDDLDVRGSDILQANGVIWVEGPSDRIYLKRWIDLFSDNRLIEGAHYTFMYYGGKILSHFDALPPGEVGDKIKIISLNRNVAVLIDSDRQEESRANRTPRRKLNDTKLRIVNEVNECGGFVWVTEGKEIENYISNEVWGRLVGKDICVGSIYSAIPSIPELHSRWRSKVDLAHAVINLLEESDLDWLDLRKQISELCRIISEWNKLE